MSLDHRQDNSMAKGSWERDILQEMLSLYRWYDVPQKTEENCVTPSEECFSLHSSNNCLPGSLESTATVTSENLEHDSKRNPPFETDTTFELQLDEIKDDARCTMPLVDLGFRDIINCKTQTEVNHALIRGNGEEKVDSQYILTLPQSSHVAQLYYNPNIFSTIAERQTKRGSYHCAHCSEKFATLLEFAAHLDDFNLERQYKCPIQQCPWKILGFQQATGLRRHCTSQHRGELNMEMEKSLNLKVEKYPGLNCPFPICQKTFKRKDAYKRHVAMVHNNADSRFNKRLKKILNNVSK
ncbi:hypothetical protein SMKI_06G0920 [Saccharomyces mikatae IFO 1815]|uniref:C2H2-type domain-containing protein n=1 Tax=Saccharomyces mikatae IFO 1815 TaxID=226126 RepID=A0AA35NHZ9_SACMI|nr:uncharacterized protein SMKI_06G0920 [Saccharomyces mikatae IFO 1815]CAI4038745.1 hypothetical protein SMKI_06G0920 [Saccharomyces mikatae IFO 1815]